MNFGFAEKTSDDLKKIILGILIIFILIRPIYADWQRPVFKDQNKFRLDLYHQDDYLYVNRPFADFVLSGKNPYPNLRIQPFSEFRYNIDSQIWERIEAGAEIGSDLFNSKFLGLYIGESFQYVWLKREEDTPELESRLVFTLPFINRFFFVKNIKTYFVEEYTFSTQKGEATRNEIGVGFYFPVTKHLDAEVNWKHIDRIHDYDADTLEFSLYIVF